MSPFIGGLHCGIGVTVVWGGGNVCFGVNDQGACKFSLSNAILKPINLMDAFGLGLLVRQNTN